MRRRLLIPIALLAAFPAAPAARADTLVASATGARNLAYGHGWLAWTERDPQGRWRLELRGPDGTRSTASIAPSRRALQPEIGTDRARTGRRLVVVYSREDARGDADVFAYDLGSGRERAIPGASQREYDETSPSVDRGRLVFVRSGGRRNGIWLKNGRRRLRRIWSQHATETATSGTRAALAVRGEIILARTNGDRAFVRIKSTRAHSLSLTGGHLAWIAQGRAWLAGRLVRNSAPPIHQSPRAPTKALRSLALDGSSDTVRMLDGEGVKIPSPAFF